jgi:hypothetical protein
VSYNAQSGSRLLHIILFVREPLKLP